MPNELPEITDTAGQVAVAIPTFSFTRLERLQESLVEVLHNSKKADEILVIVDNNPEFAQYLRNAYQDYGVTIIASEGRGASAARNTAVKYLSKEIIVFLDDDVVPDRGWLEAIVGTLSLEGVAAVGGKILPEYSSDAKDLPPELLWLAGCTYLGHPTKRGPITRPIGSTMAFRRSVLEAVGGFNVAFGPIGLKRVNSNEELPLSRLIFKKYGDRSIWFEPESVVKHWVPAERTNLRWILRRSWVEGRSKAAIRSDDDRSVMDHDRSYVVSTLLPRTLAYLAGGSKSDMRNAGQIVTASAVTATAFVWSRARYEFRRGMNVIRKGSRQVSP